MKKPMAFLMGVCVMFSVGLTSCSDDEDDTPAPAPTTAELLVGTWKMSALTVEPGINVNGTSITNWYTQLASCEKDNQLTLKADKSFLMEEGATKCNDSDPSTIDNGTWTLSTDNTKLIITSTVDPGTTELAIKSITAAQVVFERTEDLGGVNYVYTETWSK